MVALAGNGKLLYAVRKIELLNFKIQTNEQQRATVERTTTARIA